MVREIKPLFGDTIKKMMEAKMDESQRFDNANRKFLVSFCNIPLVFS